MDFVTVKPSALGQHARAVLDSAPEDWRRMPLGHAAIAAELELMGLVQIETTWQWSARNSGAGRHVVMWRKVPPPSSGEGGR